MHEFLEFTIIGIVLGAAYAVAASGLVVTYATSGIFNIAHGAIGHVHGLRVLAALGRLAPQRRA